jgi:DUF4097 and DUF4098 domain-containing protein YvlB
MDASNSIIGDAELRDLLMTLLIEGPEDDCLTETLINMEQTIAFSPEVLIPVPAGLEQQLLTGLNKTAAASLKTAGKFGLKWLFTGLGGACVATGIIAYQQLQPNNDQPRARLAVTATKSTQQQDSVKNDSLAPIQTPAISTPQDVTKPLTELALPSPETSGTVWFSAEPEVREMADREEPVESPELAFRTDHIISPADSPDSLDVQDSVFTNVKRLELIIDNGDISISQVEGDQVTIKGLNPQISANQNNGTLLVTDDLKKNIRKNHRVDRIINIQGTFLQIEVPKGTTIKLVSTNGTVKLDGIQAETCEVEAGFGDVLISNCNAKTTVSATAGFLRMTGMTGDIHAKSSFGDMELADINGTIHAEIASGLFIGKKLTGAISIDSDFGDVVLENIIGKLEVQTNSGNLNADSISGPSFTITSSFGDIDLHKINAPSLVTANSGNIEIEAMTGTLTVISNFGNITLQEIEGNIKVDGNSGDIDIRNLDGDMVVDSQFGNLDVKNSKGNAILNLNSGDLNVRDMELNDSLNLHVDFGNSKIGLKNDYDDIRFDVEASMGVVKITKGSMKLEKENGLILREKGRISVKGEVSSGNMTFN